MKHYDWNKEKNKKLITERGIGFEVINEILLAKKDVLDVIPLFLKQSFPAEKQLKNIYANNIYAKL